MQSGFFKSQAPVGGASSRDRGWVRRAPPQGVVCAALRRTCASPAAGGRSGPSEFPRGLASADWRWLPSPQSGRRSPASGASAFRLRVSARPGGTASGLRRSTRPGGWLAAVAARAVPGFSASGSTFLALRYLLHAPRSRIPVP